MPIEMIVVPACRLQGPGWGRGKSVLFCLGWPWGGGLCGGKGGE